MTVTRPGPAGAANPPQAPAGPPRPRWHGTGVVLPFSYGLLAAFATAAVLTTVTVATGGIRHPLVGLILLAAVTCFFSLCTAPLAAPLIALLAWMFDDGFIVDRHAVLAWHGSADAWRLGILLAAALGGAALGAAIRAHGHGGGPAVPAPPGAEGPDEATARLTLSQTRSGAGTGHTGQTGVNGHVAR